MLQRWRVVASGLWRQWADHASIESSLAWDLVIKQALSLNRHRRWHIRPDGTYTKASDSLIFFDLALKPTWQGQPRIENMPITA